MLNLALEGSDRNSYSLRSNSFKIFVIEEDPSFMSVLYEDHSDEDESEEDSE